MEFLHKVIFVSKKLIMEDGKVYFDNYFGTVTSVADDALVITKKNGGTENLPTDEEFYEEADEGLYELDDGSCHEDPDYIAEFLIFETDTAYEKFKDDY